MSTDTVVKEPAAQPPDRFNINVLMIDSLSRPHFERTLPHTLSLLLAIAYDKAVSSSGLDPKTLHRMKRQVSSLSFENFHGCGIDTPEVLSALFNGRQARFESQ